MLDCANNPPPVKGIIPAELTGIIDDMTQCDALFLGLRESWIYEHMKKDEQIILTRDEIQKVAGYFYCLGKTRKDINRLLTSQAKLETERATVTE